MKNNGFIFILLLSIISCSESPTSVETREFNLMFSDGRNVLNTFNNTFTKDLILNGTITVPFILSRKDLKRISDKMIEIGYYQYPDTLIVPTGDTICVKMPSSTYKFEVRNNTSTKQLYWKNRICNQNAQSTNLLEAINLIWTIIHSQPEYLLLPPAKGGYI